MKQGWPFGSIHCGGSDWYLFCITRCGLLSSLKGPCSVAIIVIVIICMFHEWIRVIKVMLGSHLLSSILNISYSLFNMMPEVTFYCQKLSERMCTSKGSR